MNPYVNQKDLKERTKDPCFCIVCLLRRKDVAVDEHHVCDQCRSGSDGMPRKLPAITLKNGKTYFVIRDYEKLRELFGQLLREVQRIKSQGDYDAGKNLIEKYGIIVDQDMMKEVKERYAKLNAAPYSGFLQPRLVAKMDGDEIADVILNYPKDFVEQMLEYGKEYSFLPY